MRQVVVRSTIVAATLIVGACASTPEPFSPPPSEIVINAPRSDRGNPNFYEVLGRRYHVMPSADGYLEDGVASWYGRDFHGRSTSSGERYDMYALTAAHKTLPLPTWVEVTNRTNGKTVIVKVNDRGPFVGDRIIDLSYAAALALDMIGNGTAPVLVRALGVPTVIPAAFAAGASALAVASVASVRQAEPEQTYLQVGAFAEPANASRMIATLRGAGVGQVHLHPPEPAGDGVHRVHVGPLASEAEYDTVQSKLRTLGYEDGHLVLEHFPTP